MENDRTILFEKPNEKPNLSKNLKDGRRTDVFEKVR